MGYEVNFLDNQSVTAEQLNAVGYNLANTAYTSFTDGTLYGCDELNKITGNLVSAGVKRAYKNSCAVSAVNGYIFIGSGLAFFENGATIEVDADGITLEPPGESTYYVFFFFNTNLNVAGARCAAELPGSNYVLLATVAGGVITPNINRFCRSKIDAATSPLVLYNAGLQATSGVLETITVDTTPYSIMRVVYDFNRLLGDDYLAYKGMSWVDRDLPVSVHTMMSRSYSTASLTHYQSFESFTEAAGVIGYGQGSSSGNYAMHDRMKVLPYDNRIEIAADSPVGHTLPANAIKIELYKGGASQ